MQTTSETVFLSVEASFARLVSVDVSWANWDRRFEDDCRAAYEGNAPVIAAYSEKKRLYHCLWNRPHHCMHSAHPLVAVTRRRRVIVRVYLLILGYPVWYCCCWMCSRWIWKRKWGMCPPCEIRSKSSVALTEIDSRVVVDGLSGMNWWVSAFQACRRCWDMRMCMWIEWFQSGLRVV